jgi:hypothetical protein
MSTTTRAVLATYIASDAVLNATANFIQTCSSHTLLVPSFDSYQPYLDQFAIADLASTLRDGSGYPRQTNAFMERRS